MKQSLVVAGLTLALALTGCHHHIALAGCTRPPLPPLLPRVVLDEPAPPGELVALILDGHTNRTLTDAQLLIPSLNRIAVADSLGFARLRNLPPGRYALVVRDLGYLAIRDSIHLAPDQGRLKLYQMSVDTLCIDEGVTGPIPVRP